jgi:hypothetical protein
MGQDTLNGGTGGDTFAFSAAAQSTGAAHDILIGVNFLEDRFDLVGLVTGFDLAVAGAALSAATFDAGLTAALAGKLQAHHAILFKPIAGDLAGHRFLIVDADGAAGYVSGADYIFDITGAANLASLGLSDFI